MRPPTPRSLLVEHPALPDPLESPGSRDPEIAMSSLNRLERIRMAVQLIAVTGLLADFELWPGRWALLQAAVVDTGDGLQMRLPAMPVPISRIWLKLGGGDPAAETTRTAVLSAIAERTGVDPGVFDGGGPEPGFFLDGALEGLLSELERPFDGATARSLWMWRWSMPPLPESVDTQLLALPDETVSRRMGLAIWAAASRSGEAAVLEIAAPGKPTLRVAKHGGDPQLRVFAGSFDDRTLASITDRGRDVRGASVAIGRFPEGWNPTPAEVFRPDRLAVHLSAMGVSPGRRQRFLDRQTGRFDPYSEADRSALTRSVVARFSDSRLRPKGKFGKLVRVAALTPDGVPVARALALAGTDEKELAAARGAHAVVLRHGRVMLQTPLPMEVDPRHAELQDALDPSDPRHLLHGALANGDPGRLLAWARVRLDDLDPWSVRQLLSGVAIGTLGPGVQIALAEACLCLADIHGARRSLMGLSDELSKPWSSWLRLLDREPDFEVDDPRPIDYRHAPRACAEIARVGLRRALRWEGAPPDSKLDMVREVLPNLTGASRRWVEIRLTALIQPESLDDVEWRASVTGGHPELMGLVLFERSIRATIEGDFRLGKRLLRRVMTAERAPGRRAFMQLNLAGIEAEQGRHQAAETLTLGAYRLFQAAGFRHRVWDVLHNLAVADIDQLRVDRAATRLTAISESNDTLFVEVERARLALAVGDLPLFGSRLAELPSIADLSSLEIVTALSFLYGVQALLAGSPDKAVPLLRAGGEEGKVWLDLAAAVAGTREVDAAANAKHDGWGIRRAAALARSIREIGTGAKPETLDSGSLHLEDALAVALCEKLAIRPGWPGRPIRIAAAAVLDRHGLTGWARRLRWDSNEVESLLCGFSGLIRNRVPDRQADASIESFLALLGVEGLALRSARSGGELWTVGSGKPRAGELRGHLELVPLGSEPLAGPAWDLLGDVLDLLYPAGGISEVIDDQSEVRIDGISHAVMKLRGEVRRTAVPRFTVLIRGETGSGKEVVAREIHRLSDRTGELVSVNIAAVPASLLEAELFGSVKGAFTGAERSRGGLVSAAEGGTLFLDEVGDLDVALQVKLLRFLESGEIRPVGSDRTRTLDVRVICATHRNLERRVREGRFRQDLYYRIAVAKVQVPALRERPEDILILRSIFERQAAERHGLQIPSWTPAAERLLMNHRWPGNLRELKNTVEVTMASVEGGSIRPDHLPMKKERAVFRGTWEQALNESKRVLLREVLTRHQGNRSASARELGITRQALLYQLKKLELTDL